MFKILKRIFNPSGGAAGFPIPKKSEAKAKPAASGQGVGLSPLLLSQLSTQGIDGSAVENWIELENGFKIRPELSEVRNSANDSVGITTTIAVHHKLICPDGVLEFQHSIGSNAEEAIKKGFENWISLDLPVLLDALTEDTEKCVRFEVSLTPEGSSSEIHRRVLLGPLAHFGNAIKREGEEHPPFCRCCLFSKNLETFLPLISREDFFGVRLFAARDQDGQFTADCRVNGQDWSPGKEALIKLASSWPGSGLTYQKQYAVIQTNLFKK